jgi:hypothetical protein
MKPSLRDFPRCGFLATFFFCGALSVPAVMLAQSAEKPDATAKTEAKSEPKKPTRDTGWVTTSDPVALLAVPRKAKSAAGGEAVSGATGAAETTVATDDAAKKQAAIADLKREIQDKQKRIALLMRLFVRDERPFLNSPDGPATDAQAQDRRKYEQNELLYETAQLGRLKAMLSELTAAGGEKTAAEP